MSWVGVASGAPCAGERMLFDESIRMRASACASRRSGRWTAIWSPSKSALNAWQTSGWTWIALPSTSIGSNAWMPRRCSVGARLSSTGCSWMTSSRTSQTSRHHRVDHLLGGLDVLRRLALDQAGHDERLEQLERHELRQTALVQLQRRTGDDDRAARVVHALAEQVLAETALLALEHVARATSADGCPGPVTGRPRRPLSNSASTASCSMRFSLLTMISGAPRSSSRLRRLLRLITRR